MTVGRRPRVVRSSPRDRQMYLEANQPVAFRLKLFGGASIEGPAGPLTGRAVQRRRLALLALLSVARRRGLTRDKLVAYLWPDSDTERARHLLSDSVYRINQALGGEAIVAAADELRLNPQRLASDAFDFGEAIEREDWERAVELHSAPFLDGFFLTGADEFERWAAAERERHVRERARALETLARAADANPAAAVRWWRMLAADDPCSSRVALQLMRSLERAGDRAAAVKHARVHAVLVREDVGVDPDPEVLRYADRLRSAEDACDTGRVDAPVPSSGTAAPGEVDVPDPGRPEDTEPRSGPLPTDASASDRAAPDAAPAPRAARGRRRRIGFTLAAAAGLAAMAAIVASLPRTSRYAAPPADRTAVAVLPFVDISPDRDYEYFADGMTEELILKLSRVAGLDVVGRSSVFAFKDRAIDVREVASRLNVDAVLEGSVRKAQNRLRIIARLVDAGNGYELWSDTYERELEDVFEIQDEISRAIVTRLRGQLPGAGVSSTTASTVDPEAYNLYLQGRFEWHKRSEQGLRNAAESFGSAVARAPEYARAHAGLGDAYAVLGFYDYLPPDEAFPRAKDAAQAALRFDAALAGPHATLGYVALYHDWEWERAEAAFLRAIELDPGYSTGRQWYANFLTAMGRFDEAIREMRAAQDRDPLSLIANAALGWVLYYAGDYDGAVEQLGSTLELNPDFELAYLWRGVVLEELGQLAEAKQNLERAVQLSGGSAISVAHLARARATSGDRALALTMLQDLEARAGYVPSFEIAKVHEALGDSTSALRWLRRAFEQRSHSMAFLTVDPQLRRLRAAPGFVRLVQDVGLDRKPRAPQP